MLLSHLSARRPFGRGSLQLHADILMNGILRDGTQTRAGTGLFRRMRCRSKRHRLALFLSLRLLTLQCGCRAVGFLGSLQQLHQMTSAENSVDLREKRDRFSENVNKRRISCLVQHSLGTSRGRWQRRRWPATATWYRLQALPGTRDRREPACPPNQAQGGCNTTTGCSTHWNRRCRGRHSILTAQEEEEEGILGYKTSIGKLKFHTHLSLHSIPDVVLVRDLSRVDECIERLIHRATRLQVNVLSEYQRPHSESDLDDDQEEQTRAELKRGLGWGRSSEWGVARRSSLVTLHLPGISGICSSLPWPSIQSSRRGI